MASSVWRATAVAGMSLVLGAGCDEALSPLGDVPPVDTVEVAAVAQTAMRVSWMPIDDPDVIGYRIERRAQLTGPFLTVAVNVPQQLPGPIAWFDTDLTPETRYGYRVLTLSRLGGVAAPSVVRAGTTPPLPGVLVRTRSENETPMAADPDGYLVRVRGNGADTTPAPIGVLAEHRFSPLSPGPYQVELHGLAPNCAVESAASQLADVVESGVHTIDTVEFAVRCADPRFGRALALVTVTGDSADTDGFDLAVTGIADDATLPDSLRIYARTVTIPGSGGSSRYDLLRPGDYQFALSGVQAQCVLAGAADRDVRIDPLDADTVRYDLDCRKAPVDTTRPGYRLIGTWGAPSGGRITLRWSIDMGTFNDPTINGSGPDDVSVFQALTQVDPGKLVFVSAANVSGAGMDNATANAQAGGVVNWLNFPTQVLQLTGLQPIIDLTYDIVGTGSVTTQTAVELATAEAGNDLKPNVVVIEGTVNLGGGGGGGNTAPIAEANGPYAGTVGNAVVFSAAGSSDPDGTIASYAWTFGDGGTGTGAAPSHVYAAAGTYTARVTVTDNGGATAQDQATVTVSGGGGGGNLPPVAMAGGPYSGTAGVPIAVSAAGSSDPDGSITAYSWNWGDGSAPGSGASATHAYSAAGTYTLTLTVTDNAGATASATTTVTVAGSGGGATPFTWSSSFGAIRADSVVFLTITLNLATDIPETASPESLATFVLDSLTYDASRLRYFSLNWGPGGFGSQQRVETGARHRMTLNGTTGPNNRAGLVTIATIGFKVIAPRGQGLTATTQTAVGALTGTAGTGFYAYRPKVTVQEGSLSIP